VIGDMSDSQDGILFSGLATDVTVYTIALDDKMQASEGWI